MDSVAAILDAALELRALTNPRTRDGSAPSVELLYAAMAAERVGRLLEHVGTGASREECEQARKWALHELSIVAAVIHTEQLNSVLLDVNRCLLGQNERWDTESYAGEDDWDDDGDGDEPF
ncbi:MAG: hypothetical protein HY828_18790 [Actinobacteria bacterium]|nr:hypothetical protein [Actinomycetota bacterium]